MEERGWGGVGTGYDNYLAIISMESGIQEGTVLHLLHVLLARMLFLLQYHENCQSPLLSYQPGAEELG
jgi:hypothetical protein